MTAVAEVRWERILLVVRLQRPDPSISPPDIHLVPAGRGPATAMPPTRADLEGQDLVLRFNVMTGPGQMPLATGHWTLCDGPSVATPLPVADGVTLDPGTASRSFPLGRSRYDVIASVDPASRTLTFRVARVATGSSRRWLSPRVQAAIRPVYRAVRGLPARACVAVARRTVRRMGRRVLFTAPSGRELRGSLQVIYDRMVVRGLDRELELVSSSGIRQRRPDGTPRPMSLPHLWRTTRLVASSGVILVTGSLHDWASVIAPSRGTQYVPLWHAVGPFKTMGYSRVGKPLGPSPFSTMHKDYTAVTVNSEHARPFFAEAFGVPIERVVVTGIPRTDRFFDPELREAGRRAALAAFPMTEGRTTILFAPTFRGPAYRATYDHDRIDMAALHALAVERDAVVIFRMHPFVHTPVPIPEAFRDRLIDATRTSLDVNDLMFVVDLLITDYSSIVYEYATLGRPMLFFAYDLDHYIATRDFYEPFESFVPGRIVRTFDALLDAIRRDDYELEKVAPFVARHYAYTDGHSADRIIDQLILRR